MLTVLNRKLTLLALVVCLSETQCAPPGTTTRYSKMCSHMDTTFGSLIKSINSAHQYALLASWMVSRVRFRYNLPTTVEYKLNCNESIAAVSPQDCQGCPVEGCKTELLRAGCWKDSDYWYKPCMADLGPCIEIRWEKNNDGSYSNSECRAKCPHLHETCAFMPVLPIKSAPTDTSKIDDGAIAAIVCSIIAVVLSVIAFVLYIYISKYRPDLVQKIQKRLPCTRNRSGQAPVIDRADEQENPGVNGRMAFPAPEADQNQNEEMIRLNEPPPDPAPRGNAGVN